MIQTVNLSDFHNAFDAIRPNNFTYEGLNRLFEYFEQLEDATGEAIELDVIGICCEFVEMNMQEVIESYDIDVDYDADVYQQVIDYISDNSIFVGDTSEGNFVFVQF